MTYIIYFIEGIKYFLGKKILFTAFLSGKLYFFAFFRLFVFKRKAVHINLLYLCRLAMI